MIEKTHLQSESECWFLMCLDWLGNYNVVSIDPLDAECTQRLIYSPSLSIGP